MNRIVKPKKKINAVLSVPGDKSISHRAVMLSSISDGTTVIEGFLNGADCLATIDCFREMGVSIKQDGDKVVVCGNGLRGLKKPQKPLYVGNSGTTIRLISGILAAQDFDCQISGDESIQKRPMKRIIEPLTQMGADIKGKDGGSLAPLLIKGSRLKGIDYALPVASAQVKSSVILAGLYAGGETVITEPALTRNHTEIMLNYLGADITNEKGKIICKPVHDLKAKDINIPGDISSAAFLMVAGIILPQSRIIITNVNVNETRTGIITALQMMGADISVLNRRLMCGEPVADIEVKSSVLSSITVQGDIIPSLIDELPILAVAALFANGETVIKDAQELKVKETDRIAVMAAELRKMGADITETTDGMIISGGKMLNGTQVNSHGDHRAAMSLAVAALAASGETEISGTECSDVSFPQFFEMLEQL